MYDSLKDWICFPFTYRRITGKTAAGDKKYTEPTEAMCYRVDNTETITDKFGEEYVSHSQLYVPKSVSITVDDLVTLPSEKAKDKEIHKIAGFYDGNEHDLSIQVIYL